MVRIVKMAPVRLILPIVWIICWLGISACLQQEGGAPDGTTGLLSPTSLNPSASDAETPAAAEEEETPSGVPIGQVTPPEQPVATADLIPGGDPCVKVAPLIQEYQPDNNVPSAVGAGVAVPTYSEEDLLWSGGKKMNLGENASEAAPEGQEEVKESGTVIYTGPWTSDLWAQSMVENLGLLRQDPNNIKLLGCPPPPHGEIEVTSGQP